MTEQKLWEFSYICGNPVFRSANPDEKIKKFEKQLDQGVSIIDNQDQITNAGVDGLNQNFHIQGIKSIEDETGTFSDSKIVTVSYHSGQTVDILVPASAIKTH